MKTTDKPKLTKTELNRLARVATAEAEANGNTMTTILDISKAHKAFEGLARGAVKSKGVVTHNLNSNPFGPGLAFLDNSLLLDGTEKVDDKETLVKGAKLDSKDVTTISIDAKHKLFKPMQSLYTQLVDGLRGGKGWSREHARRAVRAAWGLKGVTLSQRDLSEDASNNLSGIDELTKTAYKDWATEDVISTARSAFDMVKGSITDGEPSKDEWKHISKVLRQMVKEADKQAA